MPVSPFPVSNSAPVEAAARPLEPEPSSLWRLLGATLAVWLVLLLLRAPILSTPPGWDYAIGLWPEGIALHQRNFDLWHHVFYEPHWHEGGVACYRVMLTPVFIGLLYRVLGDPALVFTTYHSLVLLAGAIITVQLYRYLAPITGQGRARLVSLALLTTPLYSTQLDMLSLETFLAFWTFVTGIAIARLRWGVAILAALAAFLTKNAGYFVLLGTSVSFALLIPIAWLKGNRWLLKNAARGFAIVTATMVSIFACLYLLERGHASAFLNISLLGVILPLFWCPELVLLSCVTALGLFLWMIQSLLKGPEGRSFFAPKRVGHDALLLYCLVLCVGIFVSNMFVAVALGRYLVMVVPLLYFMFGLLVLRPGALQKAGSVLVAGLLVFNLANWKGDLLPSAETTRAIDMVHEREGSFLERSREYLADHNSNVEAMAVIDREGEGLPVFAGSPFNHFLAMPELGYVTKPISGYTTSGITPAVGSMQPIEMALEDLPREALFVYSENPFYQHVARWALPPPEPGDEILYNDGLPSPLIVYRKRFIGEDARPDRLREWYRQRLRDPGLSAQE